MNDILKDVTSLRQGNGNAPHKPILLLAVMEEIEQGRIGSNFIEITPDLIASFKEAWNVLVKTNHTPNFSLPFFHLKNEPSQIWQLLTKPGFEKALTSSNSIKSLSALKDFVYGARLRVDFYHAMLDDHERSLIKTAILKKYFQADADQYSLSHSYLKKFEDDSFMSSNSYKTKIEERLKQLTKEEAEEETFVRSGAFKKNILKLYNDTCAVTGLRVVAGSNISMVDACHIVPFSEGHDDSVQNGIALSPTIHRAFDRGLLSFDENYRVIISPNFKESHSAHSLHQYERLPIRLPKARDYYPNQENLQNHRENWGFR